MLQMTIGSIVFALGFALLLPMVGQLVEKRSRLLWGLLMTVLLAAIVVVTLKLTLGRASDGVHEMNLTPFWSYRRWKAQDVRWQIMMNVAMFVPLGAVLRSLRLHPLLILLTGLCFSVGIESLQYQYALGLCEVDDVINNTLGTLIGGVVCGISRKWFVPFILHRLRRKNFITDEKVH